MKSYYDAHETAYQQIKAEGFVGWGNRTSLDKLGDAKTIEFVKSAIARWVSPIDSSKKALDLGCGTGTTAFTMANMGLTVTGIDVSETAIQMARDLSNKQNLKIEFQAGDILQLEKLNQKFDIIYDSHCLHCIVFEEDRKQVFDGIKQSLADNGVFILDTSVKTDFWDPTQSYDTLRFDENFILWHKTKSTEVRGVVEIDGQYWCAQRRFYPAATIIEEVESAGFKIHSQQVDLQEKGESGMLRMVLGI